MDERDLEGRLRRRLRAYESRLPETDAPDPRGIRQRNGVRWPAIAGVLGSAIVVGVFAGAIALNPTRAPTGDENPSGSPSVSQPTATTGPVAGEWTLERLPDANGPAEISDVVVLPGGRGIVVGADARGGGLLQPAAWFDDGDGNWRRAEITGISDTGDFSTAYTMGTVVATDDGLISIGVGGPGAAAFRSRDGGEHWERIFEIDGIDGEAMDAIRTNVGYVAVGSIPVTDPPLRNAAMIWTSTDAISWQPAGNRYGIGALSGGFVTSVAEYGGQIVAVGSAWEDGPARGAVWISSDGGSSWIEGDALDGGYGTSIVASADGFVVGGNATESEGEPRSWYSSDGSRWTSTELEARGGVRGAADLTQAPSGFIAVGDPTDHAVAWASTDGRAWSRLPDLPTQGRSAAMAIAASEAVILAAGTVEPNAAPRQPVVWRISTDEIDSATPIVTPAPTATTSTPATASATSLRIAWDKDPVPLDIAWVDGVVADGGRMFALGADGSNTAQVLSSEDGLRWQRTELPFPATWAKEPPVFHVASHIVATDDRLLAFGTVGAADFLNVVVWQSTDDGRSWSEISTGAFMVDGYRVLDATTGPAGVVVATHSYGSGTGSVWRSTDAGSTWTEVRPSGEQLELQAVVGTASGYVLVGSECDDTSCAVRRPRIWTSVDAASWTPSSVEARDSSGEVERLTVNGSGTFVAVGTLQNRKVVWTSPDTETWTLSADLGSTSPSTPSGLLLAGLPDGFLAIDTSTPGQLITWTSSDGVGWIAQDTPLPSVDGEQVQSVADGIGRVGDRIVLAGPLDPSATGSRFSWVGHIER